MLEPSITAPGFLNITNTNDIIKLHRRSLEHHPHRLGAAILTVLLQGRTGRFKGKQPAAMHGCLQAVLS